MIESGVVKRLNLVLFLALLAGVAVWLTVKQDSLPEPSQVKETPQPQGASSMTLPNLKIRDLYFDGTYIRVSYVNTGGTWASPDFSIRLSSRVNSFQVSPYERLQVPPQGHKIESQGFLPSLAGYTPGGELAITAEIDPEDRVAEFDESDNALTVVFAPDKFHQAPAQVSYDPSANSWDGPDLIVTDVQLQDARLIVTVANQGSELATGDFAVSLKKMGAQPQSELAGLSVPAPGESRELVFTELPSDLKKDDIVEVSVDIRDTVREGRESNNTYYRRLGGSK